MYPTLAMPSPLAPRSLAPPRLAPCLTAISTATRQDSASTPNRTAPEKRFLISIFIGPSSTRRLAAARAPPPSRPARRRTRRTDSRARRGARGRRRSCPHLALDPEDRERAADHPRLRDGRHRQDDLGKVLAAHENTVRPRAAVRSSCELADDLGIRGHRLVRRRVPRGGWGGYLGAGLPPWRGGGARRGGGRPPGAPARPKRGGAGGGPKGPPPHAAR